MGKHCILFLAICISLTGCTENIYNYKMVQQVALNCFYDYKHEGRGIFEGKITGKIRDNINVSDLAFTNCFFLTADIICVSSDTMVFFYSIKNDKFIKMLSFREEWEKNRPLDDYGTRTSVSSYDTMAARKDSSTIFIFNFGTIYEYNLETDKLTKIYDGFDKLFLFNEKEYPFSNDSMIRGKCAPAYCKSRNSFIFTVQYGDWKSEEIIVRIKEFSLNDFTVRDIVKGWRPYVVESRNALYYISEDESKIIEMDLNTLKEKRVIMEYSLPIYYFVPNKSGDKVAFIHRTKNKNFKGSYSQDSKIWKEDKNKITYFSDKYWAIASDIIFPEDM